MKKQGTKKLLAILCSVMLLCSLGSVGVSADNGLEIWDGMDTIYLPYAAVFYPDCSSVPDGVMQEDLIWTVEDESIARYDASRDAYQAIAVGETTLSVATADGAYSDTVTLIVQDAIPMTANSVMVYLNAMYQARTFAYTAPQDGAYEIQMELPQEIYYGYVTVYDADLAEVGWYSDGDTLELVGGETYYIFTAAGGNALGAAYELGLTYIGTASSYEPPTSLVITEDEITMSVYDVVRLPAYTFEPGGNDWYDSVTFSTEEGSILTVDNMAGNMYASDIGTVTLTATADSNGWTDTVTVNIVEEIRELTAGTPLSMSVGNSEALAVLFTAPETKTYVFYSVIETEYDDPYCAVYDAVTGDELVYNDDGGEGYNFTASVELTQGQQALLYLGGYGDVNNFDLCVGDPVEATGVEVYLPDAVSQTGDIAYIGAGLWVYPDVRFLGGPTVLEEDYEMSASSDNATPDEYGDYVLETGQSVTFTVTTASGFTDTLTVVAIDLMMHGDINGDGGVELLDALQLFYYVNNKTMPDAVALGKMEITGDNTVSLEDALRMFYYVNNKIAAL